MSAHGARHVNDGINKTRGPDRHPMSAREEGQQALVVSHAPVEQQECEVKAQHAQVAESKAQGQTKRREQRERRVGEKAEALQKANAKKDTL